MGQYKSQAEGTVVDFFLFLLVIVQTEVFIRKPMSNQEYLRSRRLYSLEPSSFWQVAQSTTLPRRQE